MKMRIITILILGIGTLSFGQGTLTPPAGTPAPTMKTLDEIDQSVSNVTATVKIAEPRTPLIDGSPGVTVFSSGTIQITQSGSYYLTENLTVSSSSGIQISASGVTLDLNGFTIRSTSATASSSGIWIRGSNVSIFNGHIVSGTVYNSGASGDQYTGSGFQNGIYTASSEYSSIRIHDVSVSGCDMKGIYIESFDSVVESCTVETVGTRGIRAGIVNNCSATICGEDAIFGIQITDCRGYSTGGTGIYSIGTVANSYGYTTGTSTSSTGISASFAVQNSYGRSKGNYGISSNGTVANSYGYTTSTSTSSRGIYASFAVQNSYGRSKSGTGIHSEGTVANSSGKTDGTSTDSKGIYAARAVQNSYGDSAKGDGINSTIVSYSYGISSGSDSSADGIEANISIGCYAVGGENITHKYLMP